MVIPGSEQVIIRVIAVEFSQNKTTSWAIDSEPIRARRIIGKQLEIFPDRARSHSLLRGHVTAHNETDSRQNQ